MHSLVITPLDKFCVSVIGLATSLAVALVGLRSYLRNERWKRAEFLANAMKEFFADSKVQKTLTLIDWGVRRVQLLPADEPEGGVVVVTREMQTRALRPHTLLQPDGSDPELAVDYQSKSKVQLASEGYIDSFSHDEAAIRDCYDGFLDGLERISSYVQTGVVDLASLPPYIGYWVEDIHSATPNKADSAWCAALLTYITYYRFKGVLWLFDAMGYNIHVSGTAYRGFLKGMSDQDLATKLASCVNITYPPPG